MDLQNIQDQLNAEFSKADTRIIFWFDDKGEYEDEVSEITVRVMRNYIFWMVANWLYSKWLLNESDIEGKYLVYAPFPKPGDAAESIGRYEIITRFRIYTAIRVSQMSQEIGIDSRFKEHSGAVQQLLEE